MDKLQKVLNEVEILQNELIKSKKNGNGSDIDDACILTLQNIKNYIKFVQEEIVNDDLEEEITKCYKSRTDLMMTRNQFGEIIHRFTKWQKDKMMAKAIDGRVIANGMGNPILHLWDKGKHLIDKKVKVIVVKEE